MRERSIRGTFFVAAMIVFMLVAGIFCAETVIFREHIHDYQEQADYYEAKAMAVMSLSNDIGHRQRLRFNTGTVSRDYLELTVRLNDGKVYKFTMPTRFSNHVK